MLVLGVVVIALLPIGYVLLSRSTRNARSLLMVSTDELARKLVFAAAGRIGYRAVHVYRYEDAFDKLAEDVTLRMIIVDDSVPQYEAGLLLARLKGSPIGLRPLILIVDSSELGHTAPSYRAEAVVSRPLTAKALEDAIRLVNERIESLEL